MAFRKGITCSMVGIAIWDGRATRISVNEILHRSNIFYKSNIKTVPKQSLPQITQRESDGPMDRFEVHVIHPTHVRCLAAVAAL